MTDYVLEASASVDLLLETATGLALQARLPRNDTWLAAPLRRAQVAPLLPGAWARRGHLTIADAVYVVLAENLGATLVTSDTKLGNSPGITVNVLLP